MSRSRTLVHRLLGLVRREKQTAAIAAFSAVVAVGALAAVSALVVTGVALLSLSDLDPLAALLAVVFAAVLLLVWIETRRASQSAHARRVLAALEAERLELAERHASVMAAIEHQSRAAQDAYRSIAEELGRVLTAAKGIHDDRRDI